MHNIYISKTNNPYENIASEYTIFSNQEEAIFLWVNNPSVILGRNQNSICEVNHTYLRNNNINLVRRYTGGGCVYHDLGNLNYSFISRNNNEDLFIEIIIRALSKFKIHCVKSGRNDLLVNGKKISGTASLHENNHHLFHGTLLVDINKDHLVHSLTPNIKKFEGKGIQSVKNRIANLSDFSNNISVSLLKDAIIEEYQKEFPQTKFSIPYFNKESYLELINPKWIYNTIDENVIVIEKRINNELVQLNLKVIDNIIVDIQIFTDSLNKDLPNLIYNCLYQQPFPLFDYLLNQLEL